MRAYIQEEKGDRAPEEKTAKSERQSVRATQRHSSICGCTKTTLEMAASENNNNNRETAFSMRWQALKTKAENATKELAANIQEQRDRYVRERQAEKAQAQSQQSGSIDAEQREEALRIVQYQNKALRDRLRSTAAENERLHEMLKEYRASSTDVSSSPTAAAGATAATAATATTNAAAESGEQATTVKPSSPTVRQLEQQVALLRESVAAGEEVLARKEALFAEERARAKQENEALLSALEAARARVDAAEASAAASAATAAAAEAERREACERSERAAAEEEDESERERERASETASLRAEVAALRAEVVEAAAAREGLQGEVERLQASLKEELAEVERTSSQRESEASLRLMKAQKEAEVLQALLDSAKEAEREASVEVERSSSLREEISGEISVLRSQLAEKTAALEASAGLAGTVESLRAQLEETETALHAARCQLEETLEKTAADKAASEAREATVASLRVQLEELRVAAGTTREERESKDAIHAAEKVKLEERIGELVRQAAVDAERLASHADALAEARTARDAMEAELATLRTQFADAEKLNRDAQEHKRKTAEKLDELQGMIASGAKAVEERRRLQALLAERDDEIARYKEKADEKADEKAETVSPPPASPAPPSYDAVMKVDVAYLSAVLRQSFACGELDTNSPVFGVIARLLQFTEDDIADVVAKATEARGKRGEGSLIPDLATVFSSRTDSK